MNANTRGFGLPSNHVMLWFIVESSAFAKAVGRPDQRDTTETGFTTDTTTNCPSRIGISTTGVQK